MFSTKFFFREMPFSTNCATKWPAIEVQFVNDGQLTLF